MKAVVLSPHLDDAVLSIGATINSLRRGGADVVLVTAFAGDPRREARASYWDAKRGVGDKARAVALRQAEDDAAVGLLDIKAVNLPFDDFAYAPPRDPDAMFAAMQPQLEDADMVFIPGWPLLHADHRYLSVLVLQRLVNGVLFFYEERPYSALPLRIVRRMVRGRTVPSITHETGCDLIWRPSLTRAEDFAAKRAAVACYQGELAALGRHALFGKLHDRLRRREMIGSSGPSAVDEFVFGARR
jgi:LmbE family N-acetylglucosaminyl deacetylase